MHFESVSLSVYDKLTKKTKTKTSKRSNKGASHPKSTRDKIIAKAAELGGAYLGPMGRIAGGALGALGSYVTGHGDYTVSSNSLYMGTPVPTFSNGKRSVVIRHKEFLMDITSSTAFALTSLKINPGLSTTFPFLSGVAQNFEQYRFHGLLFEYRSTSANALNSTNTALGVVISATEYNANRANFINKQQMEAYEFSMSSKPSESHLHPVECAPEQTPNNVYYVRSGAVPSGEDSRLYDIGNYQIATVGSQAAATVGELWVTYEVEFFKPLLLPTNFNAFACHIGNASPTATNILGPIQRAPSGSLAVTVTATGAGYDTINFPLTLSSGYYMVTFVWRGGLSAVTTPTFTLTNMVGYNIYNNGADYVYNNNSNTTAFMFYTLALSITGQGAKIVLSGGTLPSAASWVDVTITQTSPILTA